MPAIRRVRRGKKKGLGTNFRRRGRRHTIPIGRQCRIIEGSRIVHRGRHPSAREAIFPDRRGWSCDPLLLLGEGELGHVGAQRPGGPLTDGRRGWKGGWGCYGNEKRAVIGFVRHLNTRRRENSYRCEEDVRN